MPRKIVRSVRGWASRCRKDLKILKIGAWSCISMLAPMLIVTSQVRGEQKMMDVPALADSVTRAEC